MASRARSRDLCGREARDERVADRALDDRRMQFERVGQLQVDRLRVGRLGPTGRLSLAALAHSRVFLGLYE